MSDIKLNDRLIDKIHGPVILVDAYNEQKIEFKVEATGKTIFRTFKDVQSMPRIPHKWKFEGLFESAFIGLCMVALCTVAVILVNNLEIEQQTTSEVKADE